MATDFVEFKTTNEHISDHEAWKQVRQINYVSLIDAIVKSKNGQMCCKNCLNQYIFEMDPPGYDQRKIHVITKLFKDAKDFLEGLSMTNLPR